MRNYENEKAWAKDKYVRFDVKLDKETYGETLSEIKKNLGTAIFLKLAIGLYKSKPELFKEDK